MVLDVVRRFEMVNSRLRLGPGLANITVAGLVDRHSSAAVIGACGRDLAPVRAHGLVADYSGARMMVCADELMASASLVTGAGDPLRIPTALVVHPDDLAMWRRYCDLQARAGVLRMPFVDVELAHRWAAEFAALWEAQARFRERERSRR